jgi:hypothetical protein
MAALDIGQYTYKIFCSIRITEVTHMAKKLTLYMEDELLNRAKLYSKENGVSLSKIVSGYFRVIVDDPEPRTAVSSRLRSLKGILPNSTDAKEEYIGYLEEKYLG